MGTVIAMPRYGQSVPDSVYERGRSINHACEKRLCVSLDISVFLHNI